MVLRKKYMSRSCVASLWFGLVLFGLISIVIIIIDWLAILQIKMPNEGMRAMILINIFLIILYFVIWSRWRKVTFTRKDFISYAESLGVKFTIKKASYMWYRYLGMYTFMKGSWDNMQVAAKIDRPFTAYWPGGLLVTTDWILERKRSEKWADIIWALNNIEDSNRIDLIAPINYPCPFDIKIKFENGEKEIPKTNCAEIDVLLKNLFNDIDEFYGKLVATNNYLRFTILGNSWEGRRLGERILNGFEVFRKVCDVLRGKYPDGDWKDWQITWNEKTHTFDVGFKGGAA